VPFESPPSTLPTTAKQLCRRTVSACTIHLSFVSNTARYCPVAPHSSTSISELQWNKISQFRLAKFPDKDHKGIKNCCRLNSLNPTIRTVKRRSACNIVNNNAPNRPPKGKGSESDSVSGRPYPISVILDDSFGRGGILLSIRTNRRIFGGIDWTAHQPGRK
jgi:hypothetical protein